MRSKETVFSVAGHKVFPAHFADRDTLRLFWVPFTYFYTDRDECKTWLMFTKCLCLPLVDSKVFLYLIEGANKTDFLFSVHNFLRLISEAPLSNVINPVIL
jgi:hypothetical protein